VADIGPNRTGEGFAGGDVELGVVHGAGKVRAVERAHIKRRIHVAAASLDGVVLSTAVADGDLVSVEFDGFHPAGRHFAGVYRPNELFT